MTGIFLLDWATLAISLADTILLIWLGLMVLLTAERRTWGVWLVGGSLLLGGAFFVSHSAILGLGLNAVGSAPDLWWRLGWLPVVALPFAWYTITLWYGGYWDSRQSRFHHRQRPGFLTAAASMLALAGLLIFANPFPSFSQVAALRLTPTPSLGGLPLLVIVYPLNIVLCISLSLDALLRPGPSARLMGDRARQRARPWLIATALALLAVSLLVAGVMLWVVTRASQRPPADVSASLAETVAWLDLVIAGLIGLATTLVGQAIVAYEVFTGKALPRGGLRRHWRNAILLAAGYGLTVGASQAIGVRPIYGLLLSTLLMAGFYALFSWRAYAERENAMRQLRPFVVSPRLVERLLVAGEPAASGPAIVLPAEVDLAAPFGALCESVLGARSAWLAALGPLAPLAGPPLHHPPDGAAPLVDLDALAARFDSPQAMGIPLNPDQDGATWAVPLWSERGLIGVLLLGDKVDGSPYTQEEVEIARAIGERLIDMRASAEMARRLLALQRERLAESQILDRRAHRRLHDDILPELHTAMLLLNGRAEGRTAEAIRLLSSVHKQIAALLQTEQAAAPGELARAGLVPALRALVEAEFAAEFESVAWHVAPDVERAAARLPALTAEVLYYATREALRNAARYGQQPGAATAPRLQLSLEAQGQGVLQILVEDDGPGVAPGRRISEHGGRGLALHRAMLAIVGGTLEVDSEPGRFTRVRVSAPVDFTSR